MSKSRKVEKLNLKQKPPFEEQVWLVHVVLVLLAAYLAGIIIAVLRFDEPNPLRNASVWLFVLGIGYFFVACCVSYSQSRWLRRSVVLCFLLSLICNISLLVVLALFNVLGAPDRVAVKIPEDEKTVDKFVEYDMSSQTGNEREKREFELPVEAGQPDFSQENPIGKRVTSNLDSRDLEKPRRDIEITQETPMPQVQRRLVQTVPRFSDLQGSISRQSIRAEPDVAKPTDSTSPQPETQKIVQLRESPSEIQRAQPQVAPKSIDQEMEIATDRPQPSTNISRRETDTGKPKIASAEPTMPRRVRTPLTLPRATIPSASSEAVAQQVKSALEPHPTLMQKQETTSPNQRRKIDPILEVVRRNSARSMQRSEALPEAANVASVNERSPNRTVLNRQANADEKIAQQTPIQQSTQAQEHEIAATEFSQDKTSTQPTARSELASQTEVIKPQPAEAKMVKQQPAEQTEAEDIDQIAKSESVSSTPSTVAASNRVETVNPVAATSTTPKVDEPSSAPMAVAKSIQGVSGSRAEPNFDQDARAKTSLVQSTSTAAKRSNPTQEMKPGPALAPSESPVIKRALAGAPMPSASMISQVEVGNVSSGAQQPKQIDASSSSLQKTAASNAPSAPTTAQIGSSNIDVGPTRIVANTGQSRASGGGQPEVNLQIQGTNIARSPVRESARSSRTSRIAEAAIAPSTQISDQPTTAKLDAAETAVGQSSPSMKSLANDSQQMEPTLGSQTSPTRLASEPRHVSRSTSVDASVSQILQPGGGDLRPARAARGRTVQLDHSAPELQLTGSDSSSGVDESTPLVAQQTVPHRVGSGVPTRDTAELTGAFQDERIFQGKSVGASESSIKRRTASPSENGRLAVADETGDGLPLKRAASTALPSAVASTEIVDVPLAGTDAAGNQDEISEQLAVASTVGPSNNSAHGGLEVNLDASEGVGGTFLDLTSTVGIKRRRALPESENIIDVPARFVRRQFGGPPVVAVKAEMATEAFQNRLNRNGVAPAGGTSRPSPKTEAAIELGLVFLSKQQLPDGSWSLNVRGDGNPYPKNERANIRSDTAATGLALLSFLGAGYHHRDDKYNQLVRDALQFLIERQKEDGDLYWSDDEESNRSAWLYSHAIAAIALCEAYGMTQDPWLKEPAQRAVDFIVATQNQTRGGWRYIPGVSSDTSVTGWMMMALRSAELSNLNVPQETFDSIQNWMEKAQVSSEVPYRFRYNPFAPDTTTQRHGRQESTTMTSVGLLMRLYTGWHRERKDMIKGAEYLMQHLPQTGANHSIERDTYYWYYATQVMFHMGGEYWKAWNGRLHPMLIETQRQKGENAGSWDPMLPVPDRWGAHGGRLYVTTMNLLSLEVYYRHLPIYVDTAK